MTCIVTFIFILLKTVDTENNCIHFKNIATTLAIMVGYSNYFQLFILLQIKLILLKNNFLYSQTTPWIFFAGYRGSRVRLRICITVLGAGGTTAFLRIFVEFLREQYQRCFKQPPSTPRHCRTTICWRNNQHDLQGIIKINKFFTNILLGIIHVLHR